MQPVILEDLISVAANTNNNNVIASNTSLRRYLRVPFRCKGKLVAVGSAAGLIIDMDYGSKNVVAASTLRVGATMFEPDDVINEEWYANEGDQLVLRVSNPTAGALSIRWRIVLQPWEGEFPPDCRVIQLGPIAVAAAAVDQQLLDGLRYERPPVDSILHVFMTCSAAGLTRTLDIDTENVSPPALINPANRVPQDPYDNTIMGVEVPADKLTSLAVSNPTAGSLNANFRAKWYEMVRS